MTSTIEAGLREPSDPAVGGPVVDVLAVVAEEPRCIRLEPSCLVMAGSKALEGAMVPSARSAVELSTEGTEAAEVTPKPQRIESEADREALERDKQIFATIHAGEQARCDMEAGRGDKKALQAAIREGERTKEALVVRYEKIVTHSAIQIWSKSDGSTPLEDLKQEGQVGLLKAIAKYDASKGFCFSTFAIPTIEGEIKRFMRDRGAVIRVPRPIYDSRKAYLAAKDKLCQQLGREPTPAEIAAETGLTLEIVEDHRAKIRVDSINPTGSVEHDFVGEVGSVPSVGIDLDEHFQSQELREALIKSIKSLPPKLREVIWLLFFEQADKPTGTLSQKEVGERVGVSQMQISRRRSRALAALREHLRQSGLIEEGL